MLSRSRWCLILSLVAANLHSQQSPRAKLESCLLEGRVVNSITGEPLMKVAISLWRTGGADNERYETVSTAGGRFTIRDVEPGQYRLSANKRGYADGAANGTTVRARPVLSLDPGQHLNHFEVRMSPQAVITGRVLDDDGEPLPNVGVFLLRYSFRHGKQQLENCEQANTNDLGDYRMYGLSPGRYYLSAMPNDYSGRHQQYDSGRGYAPVYYPGATDPSGAKPIDLEAGSLVRGIDIAMVRVRTVHVKGRVIDPASKQNMQMTGVHLQQREESRYMFGGNAFASVDAQGNFEIKSVVPGNYYVVAAKRMEGRYSQARLPVDVHENDIENLVLEFGAPGELKGQVRVEGGALEASNQTTVWLEGESGMGAAGRIRPDGSFSVTDVEPTHYRVNVFGFGDRYYLKSARVGDQDVLDSGLDFSRGVAGSLEVTLSANGGQVEGVVLNAQDQPEPGASVVLVPNEPRRSLSRLYRETATDQYGRFTVKGIAPGSYKLFAWEAIEDGAYENPDFVKKYEALGELRTIQEGSRESAQLQLIPTAGKPAMPN